MRLTGAFYFRKKESGVNFKNKEVLEKKNIFKRVFDSFM